MVLLSVQGTDVAQIAEVTFTSPDRVREVINDFNDDGFDSLVPKYAGGRPPAPTGDLRTHPKCTPLFRGTRHEPRQALRRCEAQQEPHDLPGGLPLPPIVVPERGPHRDRVDVMKERSAAPA